MSEKLNLVTTDFNTRALEIATDLSSIGNPDHGGSSGEDWTRARARYIRELYELLITPTTPPTDPPPAS